MKKKFTISAVMVSYNAERFIRGCLESLKGWVDEIIILDWFSSDGTIEIARSYTDNIIQTKEINAEVRINMGIEKAKSDWILRIHATERITPELKEEIIERLNNNEGYAGYYIPRKNYFYGRLIEERPGPLYLFKKTSGRYTCIGAHEIIPIKGKIGHLKNFKIHYSAITIEDLIAKGNTYTSNDVKKVFAGNPHAFACRIPVRRAHLGNLFYRSIWGFLSFYVFGKGYKYGMHGFITAVISAFYHFSEITKLWELQYKKKHDIKDESIPID